MGAGRPRALHPGAQEPQQSGGDPLGFSEHPIPLSGVMPWVSGWGRAWGSRAGGLASTVPSAEAERSAPLHGSAHTVSSPLGHVCPLLQEDRV